MTQFQIDVIHIFNKTSKILQSVLSTVVELYNFLVVYVKSLQVIFHIFKDLAKDKIIGINIILDYKIKQGIQKKTFDESN